MRLIDADKLLDAYYKTICEMQMLDNTQYSDAVMYGMRLVLKLIEKQPTVFDTEEEDN